MRIIPVERSSLKETARRLRVPSEIPEGVAKTVAKIIRDVRKRGDEALIECTEKFDGIRLTKETIRIARTQIEEATEKVPASRLDTLRQVRKRVERVERRILKALPKELMDEEGVSIRYQVRPVGSVGCYIPGGRAIYPSTLIMTSTPASVAGVPRIVATSPPSEEYDESGLSQILLAAADICGLSEIYRIGGAQAIGALAYGTESIKPVEKIVGPGNIYVTEAKLQVSRDVGTDSPAGPTELLILADGSADPVLIARDLISQAEHSPDTLCGMVTDSKELARRVKKSLQELIPSIPRRDVVERSLTERGFLVVARGMELAVDFAGVVAPEHIQIFAKDAEKLASGVDSAGLILIGEYTPSALSDYALGTNHVLPTSGFARSTSGLSVLDFVKRICVAKCTRKGFSRLKGMAAELAEEEGLGNHRLAVTAR